MTDQTSDSDPVPSRGEPGRPMSEYRRAYLADVAELEAAGWVQSKLTGRWYGPGTDGGASQTTALAKVRRGPKSGSGKVS